MYVARIELGEVGDELGCGVTLFGGEIFCARDQFCIGESAEGSEIASMFTLEARVLVVG
jgi:hypothetical protein